MTAPRRSWANMDFNSHMKSTAFLAMKLLPPTSEFTLLPSSARDKGA